MKKLRAGVVGVGMGSWHAREYKKHPSVELVALADPDEERLATVARELEVSGRYESAEEMLKRENLDVVSIATPNVFHKSLTLAALKAGCHVLCEKPMAMNAAEGRQMVVAARREKKRLMINFSFRFTPQSWALKKEMESGLLGDVYYGRTLWLRRRGMPRFGGWFGQKEMSGGGPLIDLGVHRLDLALWLMGYPRPVWVMGTACAPIASEIARREKKHYDVEDFAAAMIMFSNGSVLHLEASWAGNIKEREYMETTLLGTRGGLTQRNLNEGYEFEAQIFLERDGRQYDMTLHPPVPGVKSSVHHFVDCILSGKPHTATGEEGVTVMEILDAIYRSAHEKRPVRV